MTETRRPRLEHLHPVFERTRTQRALDLVHSVLGAAFGTFVFAMIALAIGLLALALGAAL